MCRHFITILSIFINALFTLEARFVGSSGTKYRRDGRQLSRFAVRGSKAYSENLKAFLFQTKESKI